VPRNGATIQLPAYPVKLRDTSGAGDTVVAALAVLLATKLGFEPAMRAANAAAAVAVGKRGTATVSAAELRARILPAASLAPEQKILFDWTEVDEKVGEWRRQGASRTVASTCCIPDTSSSSGKRVVPATG